MSKQFEKVSERGLSRVITIYQTTLTRINSNLFFTQAVLGNETNHRKGQP